MIKLKNTLKVGVMTIVVFGNLYTASWALGYFVPQEKTQVDVASSTKAVDQVNDELTFYGGTTISKKKAKKITVYGGCTLNDVQAHELNCNGGLHATNCDFVQFDAKGSATLTRCKITGVESSIKGGSMLDTVTVDQKLVCRGSLNAKECSFNELHASGGTELQKCKIAGDTRIAGSLKAEKTDFGGELKIYSKKTSLKACAVKKSIFVGKENNGTLEPQILELVDTVAEGDVTFEQGNGKVILSGTSKILGKLVGGIFGE